MNFEANISQPPMEAYKEYLDRRGGGAANGSAVGFSIESLLSPPHAESSSAVAAISRYVQGDTGGRGPGLG